MLYSIIPPILIVLSLIGIIVFLLKKAPRVSVLEHEERARALEAENFPHRQSGASVLEKESFFSRIKQIFLIFLEKSAKKTKLLFLKWENRLTAWGESIRKKRGMREGVVPDKVLPKSPEDEILKKVESYGQVETERKFFRPERKMVHRPMVSERAVAPRKKIEPKDQLENILIERIAINPKDTEAYARLGDYYWEIGNLADSKECFKQIVKLEPKNLGVKNKLKQLERLLSRK